MKKKILSVVMSFMMIATSFIPVYGEEFTGDGTEADVQVVPYEETEDFISGSEDENNTVEEAENTEMENDEDVIAMFDDVSEETVFTAGETEIAETVPDLLSASGDVENAQEIKPGQRYDGEMTEDALSKWYKFIPDESSIYCPIIHDQNEQIPEDWFYEVYLENDYLNPISDYENGCDECDFGFMAMAGTVYYIKVFFYEPAVYSLKMESYHTNPYALAEEITLNQTYTCEISDGNYDIESGRWFEGCKWYKFVPEEGWYKLPLEILEYTTKDDTNVVSCAARVYSEKNLYEEVCEDDRGLLYLNSDNVYYIKVDCRGMWEWKSTGRVSAKCTFKIVRKKMSGDYMYGIVNDGAEIIEYTGTETSISIPENVDSYKVVSIGEYAFGECTDLTSIKLPSALTSIGDRAFKGCSGLRSIELPSSLTSIGNSAFSGCSSLSSIELPSGLTSIPYSTFSSCSGLRSIELPSSLTSIENRAFEGCSSLMSIELPPGLTSIGEHAFCDCSSLSSIEVPPGVTNIGYGTFDGCSGLRSIELPSGLTRIDKTAFRACSGLTSIELPSGLIRIGEGAFLNCSGLKDVYYSGNKEEWDKIIIAVANSCLTQATIHYNKVIEDIPKNCNGKHTWDPGKITKQATCSEKGIITYTCTVCGETKTEEIAAAGHQYGLWETTKEATALEMGVQTRTCSGCGSVEKRNIEKLKATAKANVSSIPLKVKQSTTKVKVTGLAKGDYIRSWKSSNTKIVTVNSKGKLTAKSKTGKATITVTMASGLKKQIKVTVQKSSVAAKKISGVPKSVKLKKGKTTTLKPVVTPITVTSKTTYTSSNKKVATVSSKGKITAKKKGTAVITVKNGKKTVKCKVTVK